MKYYINPYILFVLTTVIIIAGCKNYGPSAVSGTTRDKTNQNPVPHAAVAVLERPSEILNTNPWYAVNTAQSDVDGNYYMGFTAKKNYDYRVVAKKDGFIDDGNAFADISAGQKNKHSDIQMSPSGVLKLHIKSVHPVDANDLVDIYIGGYYTFYGAKVDTSVKGVMYGNQILDLKYDYRKNGIYTDFTKNIYIKEHDTTFYEILY